MATAKSSEKLQNMVECPICLEVLNKPEALHCLHFYCKACIDDMKPAKEGGKIGVLCPLCRKFTAKDQRRPMHFIHELLEVVELAKKEQQSCDKCKAEIPIWRCNDCKENYCAPCRENHDGFSILKHHVWQALSAEKQPVMDKHVFCPHHPNKLVELHCKDCHQLICVLCNGTDHKNHAAETIDNALKEAMPAIKQNAKKLKHLMQTTKKALSDSKIRVEEIKREYDQLEREIDSERKEALKKVEADYKAVKQDLASFKNKQMKTAEGHIKELELTLNGQESIAKLSETTLSSAQGTSLLQAIQSGLRESLVTYVHKDDQPVSYSVHLGAKFVATTPSKENVLGSVIGVAQQCTKHSMYIPRVLSNVNKLNANYTSQLTTDFSSIRFAKINDQLWFADLYNTNIKICTMDGKVNQTITLSDVECCRAVAEVDNVVVVATTNDLFLIDHKGVKEQKLLDGEFCDVSTQGNIIFALDNGAKRVQILGKQQDPTRAYNTQNSITINNYNTHHFNTIQVTGDNLYIGQINSHTILQYKQNGEFVATHGTSGSAIGQLKSPMLCGSDSDGTLLVADSGNHRIQTLTKDGTWTVVTLDGLCQHPFCAIMTDTKLFVQGDATARIFQVFSFQ